MDKLHVDALIKYTQNVCAGVHHTTYLCIRTYVCINPVSRTRLNWSVKCVFGFLYAMLQVTDTQIYFIVYFLFYNRFALTLLYNIKGLVTFYNLCTYRISLKTSFLFAITFFKIFLDLGDSLWIILTKINTCNLLNFIFKCKIKFSNTMKISQLFYY